MHPKHRKLSLALRAALAVPAALAFTLPIKAYAATYSTVGAPSAGGAWETNGTWSTTGSPGALPPTLDSATINRSAPGGTVTYTATTGTRTLSRLVIGGNADNRLEMNGGNLNFIYANATNAGNIAISTQNSTGLDMSGGTLTTNNEFRVSNGSTVNISGTAAVSVTTGASGAGVTASGTLFNSAAVGGAQTTNGIINLSGGSLSTVGLANNNRGIINQTGGTLSTTTLNNGGSTLSGTATFNQSSGTATVTTLNNTSTGTINQSGGTLTTTTATNNGTLGVTGGSFTATTLNQAGGTLTINNAATNTVGTLAITGGTTNLTNAADKISVSTDYTNTGFGTGNGFNARASVAGNGEIIAAGNAQQGLKVNGGSANTAASVTLDLGNVHVGGSASGSYQVSNVGTAGPSIRGAIQTVGTGNINDARLSGSGITDSNYTPGTGAGALATGTDTTAYNVTFSATSAGALTGQAVQVVDNFGDTQTLSINGAGWRLASASAHTPEPVTLTNIHVGGTFATQAVSIQNTAANDGFSEKLDASIAAASGAASASGSFTLLNAQLTDSSNLVVGLGAANTATVGVKSGTATITLTSNGETSGTSGNSGLGTTALADQTVNITGDVYNYANAAFEKASGDGTFSTGSPTSFTLDFGSVAQNSGPLTANLLVRNTPSSLTDLLQGNFSILSGSGNFSLLGFNTFSFVDNIIGGGALSGLSATLSTAVAGLFNEQIQLVWDGYNASIGGGWTGTVNGQNTTKIITLNLTGTVISSVPEPGILWLFGSAGFAAWLNLRRKKPTPTAAA